MTVRIRRFDPAIPGMQESISDLHALLLPHSPVALLGRRFMTDFYYDCLAREGLILGNVADVDGKPAGFMIATPDANGFMRAGIARHGIRLVTVLLRSLVTSPRRFGSVWEAWQIMRHLPPASAQQNTGELLSFGILPDYRSAAFVRATGIHIGRALLEETMRLLADSGIDTVRSLVDEDNIAAKLFYHAAGWRPGRSSVRGWKQPVVEFLWRREHPP